MLAQVWGLALMSLVMASLEMVIASFLIASLAADRASVMLAVSTVALCSSRARRRRSTLFVASVIEACRRRSTSLVRPDS